VIIYKINEMLFEIFQNAGGGKMKRNLSLNLIFMFCAFLGLILSSACSPKFIFIGKKIQGRVVDDETGKPIEEAAVAIRWLDEGDHLDPGNTSTLKAAQDTTDSEGFFQIPMFPNRYYAMGVYKKGYVCWSNRDNFLKAEGANDNNLGHAKDNPVVEDGMEIRLKPFKKIYSHKRHAGFVVLIAGECTDTHNGPFNKAIESEHESWLENLRKSFRKIFGKEKYSKSNSTDP
jgi:hypothetical protein